MITPHEPVGGVAFRVHGTPAPQGSKKAFVQNGRAQIVDDNPKALKLWRDAVKAAAVDAMNGQPPFGGPVMVSITFVLVKPPTVKRDVPSVRPDLDKLLRATNDALKMGGVFTDDALITKSDEEKIYGAFPGAEIIVRLRSQDDTEAAAA